jgi:hypothetical protein
MTLRTAGASDPSNYPALARIATGGLQKPIRRRTLMLGLTKEWSAGQISSKLRENILDWGNPYGTLTLVRKNYPPPRNQQPF